MSRLKKPICPYCGKKIKFLQSWSLKKQGEYQCRNCQKISNVELDPLVSFFGVLAIFLSIIIFLIFKFLIDDVTLGCVILMMIPYLFFSIISLFLIRLKKPAMRKPTKKLQNSTTESFQLPNHHNNYNNRNLNKG